MIDVLSEAVPGTVENAVGAASSLPRLDPCGDPSILLAETPPPEDPRVAQEVAALRDELGRTYALELSWRHDDGLELVAALDRRVAAVDYPPLTAEHLLRRGSLLLWSERYREAEPVLERAYYAAVRARQDALAGEALAKRLFVVGYGLHRYEQALGWYEHALAWSRSLEDDRELRALIINNAAVVWARSGRNKRAIPMLQEAAALWADVLGGHRPRRLTRH